MQNVEAFEAWQEFFSPIRLVSTHVTFASGKSRMCLFSDAVDASLICVGVFLLHMNLQCLLVLVVPVTFGTFESLAGVARVHHCHVT